MHQILHNWRELVSQYSPRSRLILSETATTGPTGAGGTARPEPLIAQGMGAARGSATRTRRGFSGSTSWGL